MSRYVQDNKPEQAATNWRDFPEEQLKYGWNQERGCD